MNIRQLLLIIIFLSSGLSISAQGPRVGFRFETNGAKAIHEFNTIPLEVSLFGMQLNTSVFPDSNFSLGASAAINFGLKYYSGIEFGLSAKYYFFRKFFFTTGVMYHQISNYTHSTETSSWYSNEAALVMPMAGFGVILPSVSSSGSSVYEIELMYQHGGNKKIGEGFYTTGDNWLVPHQDIIRPIRLAYALKLSFGVSFTL